MDAAALTELSREAEEQHGAHEVAALAVHLMTNTAVTGATYDIDGGQQFVY